MSELEEDTVLVVEVCGSRVVQSEGIILVKIWDKDNGIWIHVPGSWVTVL